MSSHDPPDQTHPARPPSPGHLGTGADLARASLGRLIAIPELATPGDRYELGDVLGRGGMSTVYRAHDRLLQRQVALKVLRVELAGERREVDRFYVEALSSAQLQHPGTVPVHDLGVLADGRPFFAMREVRGSTLAELIPAVHAASTPHLWRSTDDGWTFRRLVVAVLRVTETIAWAHRRGLVHRDLKADNVLAGTHGEVLVVDWGVARHSPGQASDDALTQIDDAIDLPTAEFDRVPHLTGTPGFMAPEQARGHSLGPATDIWGLGATLYQVLTGHALYPGSSVEAKLELARAGTPVPPSLRRNDRPIPDALERLCLRALSNDADERGDATSFADALSSWLDGSERRAAADRRVHRARRLRPAIADLRADADRLETQAQVALAELPSWAPIDLKRDAWALQARADAVAREADRTEVEMLSALEEALHHDVDHPDAHRLLAAFYRAEHEAAERTRDPAAAIRAETRLRHHDRGEHGAWLEGTGTLSVQTEPPARATLARWVTRDRRLVLERVRDLGTTPLAGVEMPMGSYLLELDAPGHAPVRYPVRIARGQSWPPRPPEGDPVVRLPAVDALDPDDVFVPAGWFAAGGDAEVDHAFAHGHQWVDAFVIRRFPVTNREYIEFLDDLVAQDRAEEALEHAPRDRSPDAGGAVVYGRRDDGSFVLRPDADGDLWHPDWPVLLVDWHSALAYCDWLRRRTGNPWRLPTEREWEKAARGVDGRFFPWGDHLDPTWASMRDSHPGRLLPQVVDSYPVDESPYGVRGTAGNVRDWCLDRWHPAGEPADREPAVDNRVIRGGSYYSFVRTVRLANRTWGEATIRYDNLGFRPARNV